MAAQAPAPARPKASLLSNHLFFPRDPNEAGALRDAQQRLRASLSGSAAPGTRVADAPERDPFFVASVDALGHMLFACPPVIDRFVANWFSTVPVHREELLRNISHFLDMCTHVSPVLQLRISRGAEYTGNSLTRICGVSFLRDMVHGRGETDYECDDRLIKRALAWFDYDKPDAVSDARVATVLMNLVTHKARGGFTQLRETEGTPTTILSHFESNDVLRRALDTSAWFVAVLHHVLVFCEALLDAPPPPAKKKPDAGDDAMEIDTPDEDAAPPLMPGTSEWVAAKTQKHVDSAIEVDARVATASEIFNHCNKWMHEIRQHCKAIALLSVQLPDALQTYEPTRKGLTESEELLYGIPIEVVVDPQLTFLWLEWVWCRAERPRAEDEAELPLAGMRRAMADLWRAKGVLLADEYRTFFAEWDATWLFSVVAEAARARDEEQS